MNGNQISLENLRYDHCHFMVNNSTQVMSLNVMLIKDFFSLYNKTIYWILKGLFTFMSVT